MCMPIEIDVNSKLTENQAKKLFNIIEVKGEDGVKSTRVAVHLKDMIIKANEGEMNRAEAIASDILQSQDDYLDELGHSTPHVLGEKMKYIIANRPLVGYAISRALLRREVITEALCLQH